MTTTYKFNNNSKKWKIYANNIESTNNDDLILSAPLGKNIEISNNFIVKGTTVLANDLKIDNSSIRIPITYNNYAIASHSSLETNITTISNEWIDLSASGYKIEYTPSSTKSKILIHGKLSYEASSESNQLINFQLLRLNNNTNVTESIFYDMSFGSIFGTKQNNIYTFDFEDSPDTSYNITYYLKYKISSSDQIDIPCGIIGYDNSNINCFMVQELYNPETDGIAQSINTGMGNIFLQYRDASFGNVIVKDNLDVSGLEVSNNLLVKGDTSLKKICFY